MGREKREGEGERKPVRRCFEVYPCPASMYLQCEAYKRGLNCWDVPDKPCCKRRDLSRCKTCPVYIAACQPEEERREEERKKPVAPG